MTIETLNVKPVWCAEQLELLRFQLLDPAYGRLVPRSTRIFCEGELKALLLKAEGDGPIQESSYKEALNALQSMRFNPASNSRRGAVNQNFGGDLLLGWIDAGRPSSEDIFRAGHRDHFIQALGLVPLLRDFESTLQHHLPEYWQFHLEKARQLVRPPNERLKTLGRVADHAQRKMLEQWDRTARYYHVPGSQAFSTLTLNHNILFGVHDDGRNVPETLSCLTALGDYAGGTLCFPRLGITFDLRPRDLLIADTNTEYHGTVGGIFGNRYSIVAYLHGSLLPENRGQSLAS